MIENFLEYNLKTNNPVKAKIIADGVLGITRRYKSFVYVERGLSKSYTDDLYLSGVRGGSQIFEFVPVAIASTLPLISDANTIIKFHGHLKQMLEYFKRTNEPPQKVNPKLCDDVMSIVEPSMHSSSGVQINAVKANITVNNYNITVNDSSRIYDEALKEKLLLLSPTIEIVRDAPFQFIQSHIGAAKTDGFNSPDKGIILSQDEKVYSVLFDESLEYFKRELITGAANMFTKNYIVDAEVIYVAGKIKAYKILTIRENKK